MARLPALLLIAAITLAATGGAAAAGDIAKGKALAETHCSRCHVVGDFNKFGGIGSTPSFNLIVGMQDGMERFRTFFARRPHPAFVTVPGVAKPTDLEPYATPFEVTPENIEDVAAFAETLKPKDVRGIPVGRARGQRHGKGGSR
ncbi:MAG: c-type cytochrome [Rhodospirillaceae bacterium]